MHSKLRDLARLLDALNDVILVYDGQGQLVYNFGGTGRLGYRGRELSNDEMVGIVHADDRPRVMEALLSMIESPPNTVRQFDTRVVGHDGSEHTFEIIGHNLLEEPGVHGIVCVCRNVTENREAARVLERHATLRAELMAMVSHDLRTPLTVMLANLELARADRRNTLSPDTERALESVARHGRLLDRLIDDLMLLAQVDAGTFEVVHAPFDPRTLFDNLRADMAAHASAAGIEICISLDETPEVTADKYRVVQIVHNLVCNAFALAPAVTKVSIDATSLPEGWRCSVTDDGPGIPDAIRPHVFERFYSGPGADARQQCGLGLSICDVLVRAHGGRIWIADTGPDGTRIDFLIPNTPEPIGA